MGMRTQPMSGVTSKVRLATADAAPYQPTSSVEPMNSRKETSTFP